MSGWSASRRPKAARCRAWWIACATDCRSSAAVPSTQSSRVSATIRAIVATPRPSSPISHPTAPSSSISADAFDRLPSLSLSRCSRIALRLPSGSTRDSRKQESPPGAWASTRNPSDIGAEQNHLWPVSRWPSASGTARVVLARTSEPPCFSVMAMPTVAPALPATGPRPGS